MKNLQHQREHGVALVVTMIVMAVLAVVAVAFMQSATSDRAASNSLVGNYQAMLAAEAGSECAAKLIANLLAQGDVLAQGDGTDAGAPGVDRKGYDDSVTAWQNIGGDKTNEATVLYIRANRNDTTQGALPGDFNVRILARPLVSGLPTVPAENIGLALPFNTDDEQLMTEMVNLNATNRFYPDPWIGYRSTTNEGAPVTAARWIYIGRHVGPTNSTNPPIARYAYWIEDESFKLNLNIATNGQRNDTLGTGPRQLTMDGTLGASGMLSEYQGGTGTLLDDRNKLGSSGFPDSGTAAFSLGLKGTMDLAEFRFLTTVQSAGLNLSRGGFKRFNINSVTNGLAGISQSDDAERIRTNLSRVIAAITNSNSVPNFGQRFYRAANDSDPSVVNATNAVTENHADIYLQKIAANILDYVDTDNQPTLVNNDAGFSIRTGIPTESIKPDSMLTPPAGPNPIAAIGAENVPRLQEYALHAKLLKMDPIGFSSTNTNAGAPPTEADFEFTLDQYFEFWNPSTRDIVVGKDNDANTDDLGPVFLKVMNQVPLGAAVNPPITRDRDFEVAVPDGTIFPAGRVTVLTTSPEDEINTKFTKANIVSLAISSPDGVRIFKGKTGDTDDYSGVTYSNCDRFFHVALTSEVTVNGSAGNRNDYETEVLLRNDVGFLDSFANLPVAKVSEGGSKNSLDLAVTNGEILGGNDLFFVRGGSLRGHADTNTASPISAEGDPRALNEQLDFIAYQPGNEDVTRFYNTMTDGNLGDSSIGDVQAPKFVDPKKWPDFSSMGAGAANAPLVIRNSGLRSIGELGHLTDPARALGFEGAKYSRGGGRTLRIGQSELPACYDGKQTNASRTWTSWRLADVFSVSDELSTAGLINPNGALRDGGAAFRAALHGLRYLPSPEGAPALADKALSRSDVDNLIQSVAARLKDPAQGGLPANSLNVFWERGELSELPALSSESTAPLEMANTFDRGREELLRRSIEMVTMRGSVFTVYVLAQALQATPLATNVVGTARIKTTFEIIPQFAEGYANDNFPVSSPASFQQTNRFLPPTNYTHRILSSSHE